MNKIEIYKKAFREKALKNGYSEENIKKCLIYGENLLSKKLPIIYNTFHLSGLVGYKHSYLTRSCLSTHFFYRHFKIKKKNGGKRSISEPLPSLKEIQYFILNEILYNVKVSRYCKSYLPKKGFKEFLRFHKNEKFILTIDIEDFFPSIKFEYVLKIFKGMGYANDVSFFLANLCTYIEIKKEDKIISYNNPNRFLPQGAPTSPYISNLILKDFDNELALYCFGKDIKYTRYADDMAFSGNEIDIVEIQEFIKVKLENIGLKLNKFKTRLMPNNKTQVISGVVLNKKIQLNKKERKELRQNIYFINKFGLENHMKKTNENRNYYLNHLIGRVEYVLYLNPRDNEFLKYKEFLYELSKKYYS